VPRVVLAGSGIAGLFAALSCANAGWDVCVITKQSLEESSTNYAQGGIAGILDKTDTEGKEIHIKDTLDAGDGYCNERVVRDVVGEAGDRIRDLIEAGVNFQTDSDGNFDFIKEGGHSQKIILHAKDATGKEIESALLSQALKHPRIDLLSNHLALDLILKERNSLEKEIIGLWVFDIDKGIVETFASDAIILATGGGGQLFSRTTNPSVATADGMAMAFRAGAKLNDMEFVQFHPTSAAVNSNQTFLISEAVRGIGGVLMTRLEYNEWLFAKNHALENNDEIPLPETFSFTKKYSQHGSLATRDIVARAIDQELNLSGDEHVLLVTEHLNLEELQQRFPSINNFLINYGIKLGIDPIPVVPAAHYFVGGISVNEFGQVLANSNESVIKRLYAIGEVACTGMHGANRLASNSLLEAVVYSYRASSHMTTKVNSHFDHNGNFDENNLPDWRADGLEDLIEHYSLIDDLKSLKMTMTRDVGVVRSNRRLNRAQRRVNLIEKEVDLVWQSSIPTRSLIELRNMVQISSQIVKFALLRTKNMGLHYNKDNITQ
jgi:L-aspartate oxidase